MFRFFIFLLLIMIVFLAGIITGIDREKNAMSNKIQEETVEMTSNHMEFIDDEEISVVDQSEIQRTNTKVHSTQKVASFLESGVKRFYEIVVDVLYQISSLFF